MAIFILFMTDFILTYLGVSSRTIIESNPLWVWVFEMPFLAGFLLRLLLAAVLIYLPIRIIKAGKVRPLLAKTYYAVANSANAIILCVHFYWIVSYSWTV
jgi:hypothetical protein